MNISKFPLVAGMVYLDLMTHIGLRAAAPENLALAERGSRAFSNGDVVTDTENHPAGAALDGDTSRERYAQGGVWVSSRNDRIDEENPALWGVEFPQEETVNKVVLHSYPSAYWQLTDFRLEYADPSGEFRLVEPGDGTWTNPVVGEVRNVATYLFVPVTTKKLRLVITGCGANHVPWPWGQKKGHAYLAEFEAYQVDLDEERRGLRERQSWWDQVRAQAEAWQPQPFPAEEAGESPRAHWLRTEKVRAGYALGQDHFQKYGVELQQAGLNTLINHYWRGMDPDEAPAYPESTVASFHELLEPLGMQLFLWTALYFYPEDLPHPLDRDPPYRRTVDAFGLESRHGPCPLDEKMWDRFTRIARKVADLARKYSTVQGFQFDWELYAADSGTSRGSFAYNNQQCFCDHCFNLFLEKIGAGSDGNGTASVPYWNGVASAPLPREERFRELYQAGLLGRYYAALGEEVYARGVELRKILHAGNPDLILGWYGTNSVQPFGGFREPAEIFAGQSGYAPTTWFGHALARAWGTARRPMIFMPNTIWDTQPDSEFRWVEEGEGWWSGDKSLAEQARIDAQPGLHVLWVDGIIPLPELSAAGLERAVRWTTTRGNGYWINELYRLTGPRENPEWSNGAYREIIGDFWEALRRGATEDR